MRRRDSGRWGGIENASDGRDRFRDDVRQGLAAPQATLPARLLYDDGGCALFDRICDTPEYYPTRTERELLACIANDVAAAARTDELFELGSGEARKTDVLLEALGVREKPVSYVAFDVGQIAIEASAGRLLERYPLLSMRGIVGDFQHDLVRVPAGAPRLVAFLGGTLGNLEDGDATSLLCEAARLSGGGCVLIGADLVKDPETIRRAYADAAGVTEAFNLTAFTRLQREFGARLKLADFAHESFYDPERQRIEMHVRAKRPTALEIASLGITRVFAAGESIRMEISRKFTIDGLQRLCATAGLDVERLDVADVPYALVLARAR